jgi:hypothetical protein
MTYFSPTLRSPSKNAVLKNDLLLVSQKWRFVWIPKASVNMVTRSTVTKNHIEDELVFIFKNSHSRGY